MFCRVFVDDTHCDDYRGDDEMTQEELEKEMQTKTASQLRRILNSDASQAEKQAAEKEVRNTFLEAWETLKEWLCLK